MILCLTFKSSFTNSCFCWQSTQLFLVAGRWRFALNRVDVLLYNVCTLFSIFI